MAITYSKLLYWHGVTKWNMDRKFSKLYYKNRTVYYCFNNLFTDESVIPDLNLPPITFYDRPYLHKRARYTPYLVPDVISVAYVNYISTLTTPYDSPYFLLSGDSNTLHVMEKTFHLLGRVKIGYSCRKNDQKIYNKKTRLYCSIWSDRKKKK